MTATLSDQQRAALEAGGGMPLQVVDDRTKRAYYLISQDQFDRFRALLSDDAISPREMYPLIARTAGDAGWNDPAMDEYDNYDEHRSQD